MNEVRNRDRTTEIWKLLHVSILQAGHTGHGQDHRDTRPKAQGTTVPWIGLRGAPEFQEVEPPQVFLFLNAPQGCVQVLLFTFQSVRM